MPDLLPPLDQFVVLVGVQAAWRFRLTVRDRAKHFGGERRGGDLPQLSQCHDELDARFQLPVEDLELGVSRRGGSVEDFRVDSVVRAVLVNDAVVGSLEQFVLIVFDPLVVAGDRVPRVKRPFVIDFCRRRSSPRNAIVERRNIPVLARVNLQEVEQPTNRDPVDRASQVAVFVRGEVVNPVDQLSVNRKWPGLDPDFFRNAEPLNQQRHRCHMVVFCQQRFDNARIRFGRCESVDVLSPERDVARPLSGFPPFGERLGHVPRGLQTFVSVDLRQILDHVGRELIPVISELLKPLGQIDDQLITPLSGRFSEGSREDSEQPLHQVEQNLNTLIRN